VLHISFLQPARERQNVILYDRFQGRFLAVFHEWIDRRTIRAKRDVLQIILYELEEDGCRLFERVPGAGDSHGRRDLQADSFCA